MTHPHNDCATADRLSESPLAKLVGGRRGAIDGGLPPLAFVAANAVARLWTDPHTALLTAGIAAGGIGVALVALRLARKETLKQSVRGLVGVLVAVLFAAWSGEARDFFRPGIVVDSAYAVTFALSTVVGWPLVGVIHAALYRRGREWRRHPRLRRVFTVATLGWSGIYGVRALVQTWFYRADQPELLALSKLALGWPLTVLALVLTLGAIRRFGGHQTVACTGTSTGSGTGTATRTGTANGSGTATATASA